MWQAANASGRGKVTFAESQLQRSGLPPSALQQARQDLYHDASSPHPCVLVFSGACWQVWRLADRDGDDQLDLHEYLLACHLTTRHLKLKLKLPQASRRIVALLPASVSCRQPLWTALCRRRRRRRRRL